MDAFALTVFLAAHVIVACAIYLVLHQDYDDGLIGRIALVGLILAGGVFLLDGYDGSLTSVLPATAVGAGAFALFLVRHAWRFHRWRQRGAHAWPVTE